MPGEDTSVMSTMDWLKCYLIMLIPCVGWVFPLIWAFSSTGNVNRRNLFRAMLIMTLIGVGVYLIVALVFVAVGLSFSNFF